MSKLMTGNMTGLKRDNVFYDTFLEVASFYKECITEVWEESATICMADTDATVGLFDKSDIIVMFDKDTGEPMIVTERIYKENYTRIEWHRMKRYLNNMLKVIHTELGFNIKVSYTHNYIDFIHYKEEWWQWARKQQKLS